MSARMIDHMNFYNCANLTAHEDMFNGDPSTDVIVMRKARSIVFGILKSAGATGTATITVESCDDTTPTTTTAVAFHYRACTSGNTWGAVTAATTAGFTTTAGANQMYVIEVSADELSDGDIGVRLVATEVVDNPCDGAIFCVTDNHRYGIVDVTS